MHCNGCQQRNWPARLGHAGIAALWRLPCHIGVPIPGQRCGLFAYFLSVFWHALGSPAPFPHPPIRLPLPLKTSLSCPRYARPTYPLCNSHFARLLIARGYLRTVMLVSLRFRPLTTWRPDEFPGHQHRKRCVKSVRATRLPVFRSFLWICAILNLCEPSPIYLLLLPVADR